MIAAEIVVGMRIEIANPLVRAPLAGTFEIVELRPLLDVSAIDVHMARVKGEGEPRACIGMPVLLRWLGDGTARVVLS